MPDERAIVKLCALSGDDPEHVAACLQSMRAANDDAADLWRRVAARLQKGFVTVSLLLALALVAVGLAPLHLAASALSATGGSLYIMLTAVGRFLARLWSLMRRKAQAPAAA